MQPRYRPFIVGICDSSVVIAYFFGVNPIVAQVPSLLLKIFLLFAMPDAERSLLVRRWPIAVGLIVPPVMSLIFARGDVVPSLIQAVGFALFMLTRLLLLRVGGMRRYMRGLALTITISSAIWLFMGLTGRLVVVYGRPFYFHGAHPNLGAEIAVIGALGAALGMRK